MVSYVFVLSGIAFSYQVIVSRKLFAGPTRGFGQVNIKFDGTASLRIKSIFGFVFPKKER